MALRFHWRMVQGGDDLNLPREAQNPLSVTGLPDLDQQIEFCRAAEEVGIESLLTDFGWSKPDPILLSAVLGTAAKKIGFIVAYRSGLMCPTTFAQQLNTLSTLIQGRFSLNIVAGYSPQEQHYYGDFLSHDERYERTDEFLAVCHAFWKRNGPVDFGGKYYKVEGGKLNTPFVSSERESPEIYIAGNSEAARWLAMRQGTCWMRIADSPENIQSEIQPVLESGKEVGLRLSVIARATRQEALQAAYSLIDGLDAESRGKESVFARASDSVSMTVGSRLADEEWLTPCLWTGAMRVLGAPTISLVGTPQEIASAVMDYRRIGVSQFIMSGWPKLDEMVYFGRNVLPLIRALERQEEAREAATKDAAKAFTN
jgi:alkanesulfonate monooxygenase